MTVSLDYPPLGVNDGAAYLEEYPLLDQDTSRRYALAVMDGITESYGAQSTLAGVVRYFHPDEREYAGQGRSAFALNGSVEDKDGDDFFDYPDDGWDTRAGD